MSESPLETTNLKAQYTAQVTADLERNAKEQERISAEITALQEHLDALRHDQTLLASMQQALGGESAATAPAAERGGTAVAPAPRKAPTAPRPRTRKKAAAPGRKTAAASSTTPPRSAKAPTLGVLIREYLHQQPEPRSAAEVTAALAQAHPERKTKTKVVRVTLEGLVAKGLVERTKQNKSVFYTAASAAPADNPASSSEPADVTAADAAQQTGA